MNLLDQTEDVLIEQLRYLPIQDLLNACQTNLRISQICQDRRLWDLRLMDDFQVHDLGGISDPRGYYFLLLDRKHLLDWILQHYPEAYFDMSQSELSAEYNINTYHEFIDSQRQIVEQLTEPQLNEMKILMKYAPGSAFYDPGQWGPGTIAAFFFEPPTGAIVYFTV